MSLRLQNFLIAGFMLSGSALASAASMVVVNANNDLYNANGVVFDGTAPQSINVAGLSSITFSVSKGSTVTVNGGTLNDADGIGSLSGEYNTGGASISGISSPTAGFIAGVFEGSSIGMTTPAALNFTVGGTSFGSLSPLLQQSFFIGDGRTGDAAGATQTFYVPTGAKTLYLGLTDACGYSGSPSCFGDNSGVFTVTANGTGPVVGGVPEPTTWALLLTGFGCVGYASRRRVKAQVAA
ncbi:PEPxxWA-CTERM sorting domain-containing protein [Polymorphobacter megasporae]|uniref:PEPxxWA-CTERM sorting domain-containing protein n=1 Tax=Glacieibacterium megasporae TaxID=2835787 RepID=UPI001C1DDE78|nr:PEPxxWA-CTERM sorting domain-containing protein [Polymorphobacter megasporae]UAJ12770.1 PEPxxWA-CTERM sorting domain-containing protein [Polymorphobacter megasporae]